MCGGCDWRPIEIFFSGQKCWHPSEPNDVAQHFLTTQPNSIKSIFTWHRPYFGRMIYFFFVCHRMIWQFDSLRLHSFHNQINDLLSTCRFALAKTTPKIRVVLLSRVYCSDRKMQTICGTENQSQLWELERVSEGGEWDGRWSQVSTDVAKAIDKFIIIFIFAGLCHPTSALQSIFPFTPFDCALFPSNQCDDFIIIHVEIDMERGREGERDRKR